MTSTWRITYRALAAVARKDAGRSRLLSVFLYPWVLGSIALLVGTSWIPDWLWDLVGVARLRPSSPEAILRAWIVVGLWPAAWISVRTNVLSESREGGWTLLRRLPVRPGLLVLSKAAQGLAVQGVMAGVGLLLAVTASAFGEISGEQAWAAAAGLGGALTTFYAVCFLAALLGRHGIFVWGTYGGLFVLGGAWVGNLPGGAIFRRQLSPGLLREGVTVSCVALSGLALACWIAGMRGGRVLDFGRGRLRSLDVARGSVLGLVLLAPWALGRPSLPAVELAGPALRASAPLALEVEDLETPGPYSSAEILAALSEDLTWLAEAGLEVAPLALAHDPNLPANHTRSRGSRGARGLILNANLRAPELSLPALRADALQALFDRQPGWRRGSTRLLGLGLPLLRTGHSSPHETLWAAWALAQIESEALEGGLAEWLGRWAELETRLGRVAAQALASVLLRSLEARTPGASQAWVSALAQSSRAPAPDGLLSAPELEALLGAEAERLARLPTLERYAVQSVPGGLRYRAQLGKGATDFAGIAPLESSRLVLRTWRPGGGEGGSRVARAEALLGAPGFDAGAGWASLTLPAGEVRWQLGLALPSGEGELVFAAGRGVPE